jgi:hypothetical protein
VWGVCGGGGQAVTTNARSVFLAHNLVLVTPCEGLPAQTNATSRQCCSVFPFHLQVVKARGAAMAAAASAGGRPHGMLSVVGLVDDQLQQVSLN